MKVLHVTQTYFPDSRGGIEEVVRQLCLGLKKLGIDSKVFTLSEDPNPSVIHVDGVEVIRYPLTAKVASCGMSLTALKKFKPLSNWAEVINYHFPWPFMDLLHFIHNKNAKIVVTYHSDIIRQKRLLTLYRPMMKRFLDEADIIVATSENYFKSSKVLNHYKDKVEIIPIGVDINKYPIPTNKEIAKINSKVGKDFFLFVGMLRKYKGLSFLLKAIKNTKIKLVVAGSGPEEKVLKSIAKKLKLENVNFLGQVSDIEKVALIKLCRAVVLSSHLRSEAYGVALLEGAMYKKPLISTELSTGTSYVNIDGITGLVVPPSDELALQKSMLLLDSDNSLSQMMGKKAFNRYNELFSGSIMADSYSKVYYSLLS